MQKLLKKSPIPRLSTNNTTRDITIKTELLQPIIAVNSNQIPQNHQAKVVQIPRL